MAVKNETVASTINSAVSQSPMLSSAGLPNVASSADLRKFGEILTSDADYINEFARVLNRIIEVVVWNRAWKNPLEFIFKDGNYGESIEEIFVNTAQVSHYDPFGDGADQWKRVMPDVRSAIHRLNAKFYAEQTVYDKGLRQAFLSFEGFSSFFQGIITALYNGISSALYEATKYLIADYILTTGAAGVRLPSTAEPKDLTVQLKTLASKVGFISTKYNSAGVETFTSLEDLFLITTPEVDATQSVEVLAYMFNVGIGDVPYRRIIIDSFYEFNYRKLNEVFDGGVRQFTQDEVNMLKEVKFFVCDRNLLILYDMMHDSEVARNKLKLYQNYFMHLWAVMSYSPFATGIVVSQGDDSTEISKWKNPYADTNIRVGRDNKFYVMPATAYGTFTEQVNVEPTITGNGLIPIAEHPGWYLASNNRGTTSTLTYAVPTGADASMQPLVINIEVV